MSKSTMTLAAAIACAMSTAPALADDAETLRQIKAQMAQLQAQMEAMQNTKGLGKAVQLYGQARVSLDNHSGDWPSGKDGSELVSNASRIGVKGKTDTALDNTALFYQAELRYETTDYVNGGPGTTTGTKQVEFRESFAGLKGGWGKARMGRLSMGYKKSLTKIDPWNDNAPQSRSGGRQGSSELHSSYVNNAVDYETPKLLGGITGNAWYSSRFDDSSKPMFNTGTLKNYQGGQSWGLGVKYNTGPLFLAADWIDINADAITKAGLQNDSAWQVSGRYKFGPVSVAALYEDAENLGLGKNTYVNGIYKIDRFRFIGAYGQNRDGAVYGNKDWNNWTIGAKYALTKKSELLAAWNRRRDDTGDKDFDTITVGVNAKFGY